MGPEVVVLGQKPKSSGSYPFWSVVGDVVTQGDRTPVVDPLGPSPGEERGQRETTPKTRQYRGGEFLQKCD